MVYKFMSKIFIVSNSIYLVDYSRSGRNNKRVIESRWTPFKEIKSLFIPLKLKFYICLYCILWSCYINLNWMIYNKFHWNLHAASPQFST